MPDDPLVPVPHRRSSDPPAGSLVARWNEALKPWIGLIAGIAVVYSIASTVLLALGFRFSTPVQQVDTFRSEVRTRLDTLTDRVTALEEANRESKTQRDRTEQWTVALIRSKCLELRGNAEAQALSVLPCDQVFGQWPGGASSRYVPPLLNPAAPQVATYPAPATLPPTELEDR